MKRTDINDEFFYQKDRKSSKGKKKNFLNESDAFERKKKIHFKNFVKNARQSEYDDEEGDY
jgi:hypothetical protein